jgi:hypothetical protein
VFRWAAAGKRLLVCTIQVAIFKASRVHDAPDSYASATNTFDPTPQLSHVLNPDVLQMPEFYFLHSGRDPGQRFYSESVSRCPALAVMN